MSVRAAVGIPRTVAVDFPGEADTAVSVSVTSARAGATTGPFVADVLGDGRYSYTLTPAQVAEVDELTVLFSGEIDTVDYQVPETVDVAGRHYFTVAEARRDGPIAVEFTDDDIDRMRMVVEDQIEANCDTYFTSRYVEETVSGGQEFIRLTEDYVLGLIKVTESGTDVTDEVDLDGRYLWHQSRVWTPGRRNLVVQYEAGYDTTPSADLKSAAIEATRFRLLKEKRAGIPTQVVTMGTDVGTLRLAVAGMKQPFGHPEVDAVVIKWAKRVGVPVTGA